ncbi:hypothetical protein JX266_013538 [Neoarthrinium moseri]|nr:hypothetical protein JX266_013538 [Neoarthrinium moseri]
MIGLDFNTFANKEVLYYADRPSTTADANITLCTVDVSWQGSGGALCLGAAFGQRLVAVASSNSWLDFPTVAIFSNSVVKTKKVTATKSPGDKRDPE